MTRNRSSQARESDRRRASYCWPLLLLLCLSLACREAEEVHPDAVAQVAERQVTLTDWRVYLARQAVGVSAELDSRVLSRLLDQFVDELILRRWAEDQGLVEAEAQEGSHWGPVLAQLSNVPAPTREEEARWMEQHRRQLRLAERVRVLHLSRDSLAIAESVLAELEESGPKSWQAKAEPEEEFTTLPVASLPVHLVEVVSRLDVNHRGEVVDAGDGYHVVWLEERLPARELSPLEAAERARTALRRERTDERRLRVVEEGRDRYNARVWAENLPFDYKGSYSRDDRDRRQESDSNTDADEPIQPDQE